jgi:hypothetical protein
MYPVVPIERNLDLAVTAVPFGTEQGRTIPVYVCRNREGTLLSRWRLTWRERLRVFFKGEVFMTIDECGESHPAVLLHANPPRLMLGRSLTLRLGRFSLGSPFPPPPPPPRQ